MSLLWILLGLGFVWLLVRYQHSPSRAVRPLIQELSFGQIGERAATLWRRPIVAASPDVAPTAFVAWVEDKLPAETAVWLTSLSPLEQANAVDFAAQFCRDLGFELADLLQGHYQDEATQAALTCVVDHTLQAMQLIFETAPALPAADEMASMAVPMHEAVGRGRENGRVDNGVSF